jgi:AraC family transcriptional regulator
MINCRVEEAKRLLADDELPLVDVGLSVGYQNQSRFTTLFRRLTGVTPKAYRDGI